MVVRLAHRSVLGPPASIGAYGRPKVPPVCIQTAWLQQSFFEDALYPASSSAVTKVSTDTAEPMDAVLLPRSTPILASGSTDFTAFSMALAQWPQDMSGMFKRCIALSSESSDRANVLLPIVGRSIASTTFLDGRCCGARSQFSVSVFP